MSGRKTPGALAKVGRMVKQAAQAVADQADQHVVEPVGKALGLIEEGPSEKPPSKSARKAARKVAIQRAADQPVAVKRAARRKAARAGR